MVDSELFKFVEQCLREYDENQATLEQRRWDRQNLPLFADPSSDRVQGGDVSEPVFSQLLRIEDIDEEIRKLESRVIPIQRGLEIIEKKRPHLLPILDRYFQKKPWKEIRADMNCSRKVVDSLKAQMIGLFARLLSYSWRWSKGNDF